jgi:IS1 family transposase
MPKAKCSTNLNGVETEPRAVGEVQLSLSQVRLPDGLCGQFLSVLARFRRVFGLFLHRIRLSFYRSQSEPSSKGVQKSHPYDHPLRFEEPKRFTCGLSCLIGGLWLAGWCGNRWVYGKDRWWDYGLGLLGLIVACGSASYILLGSVLPPHAQDDNNEQPTQHNPVIVPQKHLDTVQLLGYSNYRRLVMANVLSTDKKIAVIGALAEGSSIRSIERITGVHRDTIMRLGVKVGQGCTAMMDTKMRNLSCKRLEMDEIWGFVGKKERHVKQGDSMEVGSVWTFCAIDSDTKLVPAFKVGHRDPATTQAFVKDVAERMAYRVQISTDGLRHYVAAMDKAFGQDVDYAQIIKIYGNDQVDNRRYSPPSGVQSAKKLIYTGNPEEDLISTSYIERLNATTRLHMRRLTRLTLAFSKKHENFVAAVGLHFAYYNFVKRHNTLRMTPAMAAGVEGTQWSVGELLEAAA